MSFVLLLAACGGGNSVSSGSSTITTEISHQNQWTWIGGADQDTFVPIGTPGPGSAPYNSDPYYGTLGVAGAVNVPGGRNSSAYWTDRKGNFWLFGGDGLDGSSAPNEGLLNDLWEYSPMINEWTWVGGSSALSNTPCLPGPGFCGLPGVYGSMGTPSPSNVPGGRKLAVSWTDSAGNLWLFGGLGIDSTGSLGNLNDLWEFNPSMKEWTWISGSNTLNSSQGLEGIYGTQGVADAANVPPGLNDATGWIDKNDNLWLFAGSGVTPGGSQGFEYNNLWKFDPSTREWTWMTGTGTNQNTANGVYGTLGTAAPGNTPSGRFGATGWMDSSGNMWLFGGYGIYPSTNGFGENDVNELWEFNPTSNLWTWVAGTAGGVLNSFGNLVPPSGAYGSLGVASADNHPGGRYGGTGWIDGDGNIWLFGGEGDDSTGTYGTLNDLWEFSPVDKEWTWMGGDNTAWQGGIYGTEGTSDAANIPGSRYNTASWKDSRGNFWLFAGWGIIDIGEGGSTALNDLWYYQP